MGTRVSAHVEIMCPFGTYSRETPGPPCHAASVTALELTHQTQLARQTASGRALSPVSAYHGWEYIPHHRNRHFYVVSAISLRSSGLHGLYLKSRVSPSPQSHSKAIPFPSSGESTTPDNKAVSIT